MMRVLLAAALSACTAASPPSPPGEHLPGYVSITQRIAPDQTWLGASFQDGRDPAPETAVDGCTLSHYRIDSLASSFDAGLITISGTSIQTLAPSQRSLQQIEYGTYSMDHPFVAGETLEISTTGATVPSFSTPLAMPAQATIDLPASLVIDRGQPFLFTWTGGTGEVVLTLSFAGQWFNCRFPASTGSATVPADVMAMVLPGSGYLDVVTRTEVNLAVAPWDVQAFAIEGSAWPDGSAAHASVMFQ